MVFDEWKNWILVAFIIIGNSQESDLDQFSKHYQNVCQAIGCLMLSLLTMFKLKSMCWGLTFVNLHTISCLLLVYCNAYFVAKPNNLVDHSLLHIIFWHKLCFHQSMFYFMPVWHRPTHYWTTKRTNFYRWCFPMQQCLARGQSFFMFVACVQNMGKKCFKENSNSRRPNKNIIYFGPNNVFMSLSIGSWSYFVGATTNRHHGNQIP